MHHLLSTTLRSSICGMFTRLSRLSHVLCGVSYILVLSTITVIRMLLRSLSSASYCTIRRVHILDCSRRLTRFTPVLHFDPCS